MQPQATQTPPATDPKQAPASAPADSAPPAASTPAKPAKSGYGKRPVWQWVLIYVVLAVIVYGIIYFVWMRKTGPAGTTSGY
jgi:magnesium-transporting ATPase (P-type)